MGEPVRICTIEGPDGAVRKRPARVPRVLLAGFLAAGWLAGCGGQSHPGSSSASVPPTVSAPAATTPVHRVVLGKSGYNRTMRRLGSRLSTSIQGLYPLVTGPSGSEATKEALARMQKARAVVTSVSGTLAAIVPPKAVRPDHQRLVRAVGSLGTELDNIINHLQRGTSKPLGTYFRLPGLQQIARAVQDIEAKGYAIG